MQKRYLGDVHDFLKYAFIRHLHRETNLKIGLNWYLTDPKKVGDKEKKDGEKRYHFDNLKWENWDDELLKKLRPFRDKNFRCLKNFYKKKILAPETIFYEQEVLAGKDQRKEWHNNALKKFHSKCNYVFLDPDNGLEVKSAKGKKLAKYALYDEMADYFKKDIAVTTIQFARQCKPIARAKEVRKQCMNRSGANYKLPALCGRVSPNILFIALAPPAQADILCKAIHSFAENSPPYDKQSSRMMLIK